MQPPEPEVQESLEEQIVRRLAAEAHEAVVADVRIGLGYTAVLLADGHVGVAFTFRDRAREGCSAFSGARPLTGRTAAELVQLLTSDDPLEASVALACANALTNRPKEGCRDGDVLEHLAIGPADDVAMVGHFGPLVGPIRERARSLTMFERVAAPGGVLRPWEEAASVLPRCQVVLITATAIINHTIDELVAAAHACRDVTILGASTPLIPEVFGPAGVTMLSGVVVTAPDGVLRVVSEGGGMRQFGPHVRKVTMGASAFAPKERGIPR